MKVSFVIPAYNEEKLIGNCIESALREIARSGYECEIIVADNDSTDRTKDVAGSYPGVRVVEERRKGSNRAREAGFRASSGELSANIDADTIVPEGWLTAAVRILDGDPRIVAVSGPFIYYDLPLWQRALVRVFLSTYLPMNLLMQYVLRTGAVMQGGNFVVRHSALEKIGGHNTAIEFYGDDTDTARRLAKVGRVKWTFALPMYTSGRRLIEEGMFTAGFRYTINFFSMIFLGKPFTLKHTDIRAGSA